MQSVTLDSKERKLFAMWLGLGLLFLLTAYLRAGIMGADGWTQWFYALAIAIGWVVLNVVILWWVRRRMATE